VLVLGITSSTSGGPDWWQLLVGTGVLVPVIGWLGKAFLLWRQRTRFEVSVEGDPRGAAWVSVTSRGEARTRVSAARIVVRKGLLYRTLYLITHLRQLRTPVLKADEAEKSLLPDPARYAFEWDRSKRDLPPRWPWLRNFRSRSWEEREIRLRLLTIPRRFSGFHKVKWKAGERVG
jgi:hypothetical protein